MILKLSKYSIYFNSLMKLVKCNLPRVHQKAVLETFFGTKSYL